jgi:hypothetical protein
MCPTFAKLRWVSFAEANDRSPLPAHNSARYPNLMRRFLPLLLLVAATPAHSQALSIYGTYSPSHLSNVETGAIYSATSGYVNQTTSYWSSGFGGGLTANFLPIGPLRIGFDLRGSVKPGSIGANYALFGVKVGVHPAVIKFHPYGQFSVGYLSSSTTNVSTTPSTTSSPTTIPTGGIFANKYAAFEIMGGVDYPILSHLDLRIIELGGGGALSIGGSYKPTLFTVNSGLVLHF